MPLEIGGFAGRQTRIKINVKLCYSGMYEYICFRIHDKGPRLI
jgi:hypothetical protein